MNSNAFFSHPFTTLFHFHHPRRETLMGYLRSYIYLGAGCFAFWSCSDHYHGEETFLLQETSGRVWLLLPCSGENTSNVLDCKVLKVPADIARAGPLASFRDVWWMFLRITYFSEEESKSYPPDFPGPVDKNLPVNIGDRGSIPGLGRSHPLQDHWVCVLQQLSPCASQPVLHRKRSHCNEEPWHCNEE